MPKYLWTTLVIVGFCAVLVVTKVFGAYTQTQVPMDNAVVVVTNAAPDVEVIDVYIDHQLVLQHLSTTDLTDYLQLTPGNHLIDVAPAGENTMLIKTTELAFEAGHTYQLALDGLKADWSVALRAIDVTSR
jgi:uncharacterized protein DUF4397